MSTTHAGREGSCRTNGCSILERSKPLSFSLPSTHGNVQLTIL